jgi:hypothetical protein
MAKHKHRDQSARINDTNNNINSNNNVNSKSIPFGIDPMQLMGLLGGNFDINNMGNMLSSMNTNGFNLGNLGSIAQMMGINLDNSFSQGNMTNPNNDLNKNIRTNTNQSNNHNKQYSNATQKGTVSQSVDKSNKKNTNDTEVTENDVNLTFLMALKNHVHPDRIKFIDKIIEAYKNGEFKDI